MICRGFVFDRYVRRAPKGLRLPEVSVKMVASSQRTRSGVATAANDADDRALLEPTLR